APLPFSSILFDSQSAPALSSPIFIASPNKRGHDCTGHRLCPPRHLAMAKASMPEGPLGGVQAAKEQIPRSLKLWLRLKVPEVSTRRACGVFYTIDEHFS